MDLFYLSLKIINKSLIVEERCFKVSFIFIIIENLDIDVMECDSPEFKKN